MYCTGRSRPSPTCLAWTTSRKEPFCFQLHKAAMGSYITAI
jgi:hypothetical protein